MLPPPSIRPDSIQPASKWINQLSDKRYGWRGSFGSDIAGRAGRMSLAIHSKKLHKTTGLSVEKMVLQGARLCKTSIDTGAALNALGVARSTVAIRRKDRKRLTLPSEPAGVLLKNRPIGREYAITGLVMTSGTHF
jgi:hypothetical protein